MFLATTTAANSGVMSTGMLIMWLVIMFGMMYFLMIRPQKKEQKKLQAMLNDLAVGDAVVTTSGFYGVVIDITDDDVIVEFGNNKNCRIPMRKTAGTAGFFRHPSRPVLHGLSSRDFFHRSSPER